MVPDERIADSVASALRDDPRLKGVTIARVDVARGVVRLEGTVGNLLQKQVVERIASRQEGVKRVLNQVVVVSEAASDEEIAARIQEAIENSRDFGLREVGVQVSSGEVVLIGRVANEGEEQAALQAAYNVPGVRQVTSRILIGEVEPDDTIAVVDDAALRSRVATALARANIDVLDQELAASNGIVFLRGEVFSPEERKRAEEIAQSVDGVRGTRNELRVR